MKQKQSALDEELAEKLKVKLEFGFTVLHCTFMNSTDHQSSTAEDNGLKKRIGVLV